MEAELEEMRNKLKEEESSTRKFKSGDKVLLECVVDWYNSDGDLRVKYTDYEGDLEFAHVDGDTVRLVERQVEEFTLQRDKYVVINNTSGHSFAVGDTVTKLHTLTSAWGHEYTNNKGYQQELRCSEVQKIVNPEYLDASLDDTPCGKLGYKAGDLFVVVDCSRPTPIGTVVMLTRDDTTSTPRFDTEDDYWYIDLDHVVKINK